MPYSAGTIHLFHVGGVITNSVSRTALILCVLGLVSSFALSYASEANPIGSRPEPPVDTTFKLSDPVSGITWLYLINISFNLIFVTSFLMLIADRIPDEIRKLPIRGGAFLVIVLVVTAVVTLIGAVVDYYYVMGVDADYDENARVVVVDAVNWARALIIIFISVALPSFFLLRLTPVGAIVMGSLVTAVNPLFWILSSSLGYDVIMAMIIIGVLVVPGLTVILLRFHNEFVGRRLALKPSPA